MGFRAEHINPAELASIRRGRSPHFSLMVHVAECSQCKQQLAESLILGQFMRKEGVAQEPHLPNREIDRYNACAYEGAKADPHVFFATHEHLQRCDGCFAKFLRLHEQLSPSKALVERIMSTGTRSLPRRSLGALILQKAFDSVTATFRPRRGEVVSRGDTLKEILRGRGSPELDVLAYESPSEYSASYSERRPPGGGLDSARQDDVGDLFSALSMSREAAPVKRSYGVQFDDLESIRAGTVALRASARFSHDRVYLDISAVNVHRAGPAEGVEVTQLDDAGSVLDSRKTDSLGRLLLEIAPRCERLAVRVDQSDPWEIRLDIREEPPRARGARIRAADDAALREGRAKATEERMVRRAANVKSNEEVLAHFKTLSPADQVKAAARDKIRPIFFYQQHLPVLDRALLEKLDSDLLQELRARLAPVRRGPLVGARASLDAYLADRGKSRK